MSKEGRRAKARDVSPAGRKPKAAPASSTQSDAPLFCFAHADRRGGDVRWAFAPQGDHATELFEFICEMAKLSWADIERQQTGGRNRHRKHHDQAVESICPEAQLDFERCKLGERFGDTMFRFRVSGEKRLWGFRVGRTFHVIWWDPGHNVYETEPN